MGSCSTQGSIKMKKEGSWIATLKRIFICNAEEKVDNGSWKKREEKGVKVWKIRHGERSPFFTMFRGTSSIEKILEDAEKEQQLSIHTTTPVHEQQAPAFVTPVQPQERSPSPLHMSSSCSSSPFQEVHRIHVRSQPPKPSLSLTDTDHAAIKIQTAYRGYVARRSLRGLRGLVRLQGVARGQNVKRQTTSAVKHMQLLFRVQSQVRLWRTQMLERRAIQQQQQMQSTFQNDGEKSLNRMEWDDSQLSKGEAEARLQKKGEGVIKRRRAVSYAYSHQVLNFFTTPLSSSPADVGFPWWWNRLEPRIPGGGRLPTAKVMSPRHSWSADSPGSARPPSTVRRVRVPSPLSRSVRPQSSGRSTPGTGGLNEDGDSQTGCPHFSGSPNYMTPTASALAKARTPETPPQVRRLSYPLTPSVGSSKWNSALGSPSCSAENGSLSSAASVPSTLSRLPFNRFV